MPRQTKRLPIDLYDCYLLRQKEKGTLLKATRRQHSMKPLGQQEKPLSRRIFFQRVARMDPATRVDFEANLRTPYQVLLRQQTRIARRVRKRFETDPVYRSQVAREQLSRRARLGC